MIRENGNKEERKQKDEVKRKVKFKENLLDHCKKEELEMLEKMNNFSGKVV